MTEVTREHITDDEIQSAIDELFKATWLSYAQPSIGTIRAYITQLEAERDALKREVEELKEITSKANETKPLSPEQGAKEINPQKAYEPPHRRSTGKHGVYATRTAKDTD